MDIGFILRMVVVEVVVVGVVPVLGLILDASLVDRMDDAELRVIDDVDAVDAVEDAVVVPLEVLLVDIVVAAAAVGPAGAGGGGVESIMVEIT